MSLLRRGRRPPARSPYEDVPDPRIWGRHYTGPKPWVIGAVVAALALIGMYMAFAKELPWADEGYTVTATFENAATLRATAPVRIAGVNVGEVTGLEANGEATDVTFTVADEGRPIHEDAEVKIRPRLFLEGNFFLELEPGSPSAPELEDGGAIPITRTSTAVQLDEVLAALQEPQRRGLQRLLEGFGRGLAQEPDAAADLTQDPDVQGESAARSLNDAFRYGGDAGRSTAIVAEALRGRSPHDLSALIRSSRDVFAKLASRDGELSELITNFNATAGAFSAESGNLSASVSELGPTLEEAEVSLRHLSDALPPLRTLAAEAQPGFEELPDTIAAFGPWLEEAGLLLRDRELGGTARSLARVAPGLAATAAGSKRLFPRLGLVSRCTTENLVPAADSPITADSFATGQPNFQELFYAATQIASAGQGFDGNGPYLRLQPAGGELLVQNTNPGGAFNDTRNFGSAVVPLQGVQPPLGGTPPFRMDVPCHENPVPDLNGPAAAAGPPDLVAP